MKFGATRLLHLGPITDIFVLNIVKALLQLPLPTPNKKTNTAWLPGWSGKF